MYLPKLHHKGTNAYKFALLVNLFMGKLFLSHKVASTLASGAHGQRIHPKPLATNSLASITAHDQPQEGKRRLHK